MATPCRAKLNHLYVCVKKKELFIEIIRSFLKSFWKTTKPCNYRVTMLYYTWINKF